MKRSILSSRNTELHDNKVNEACKYVELAIKCLEVARPEAWNGDSSGNLLKCINQLKYSQKYLLRYRSGDPVRSWEGY